MTVWATSRAIEAGCSLENCAAVGRQIAANTHVFVFVPTVEYFVRGGRLTPLEGRIAKLLHLCPILTVDNGKVVPAAKAFGQRWAQRRILREVLQLAQGMEQPAFVISHSAAPDLAEAYRTELLLKARDAHVWITDTTPAIGSHAGPGGAAIAVVDAAIVDRQIKEALR